jgi:hypothetical protein
MTLYEYYAPQHYTADAVGVTNLLVHRTRGTFIHSPSHEPAAGQECFWEDSDGKLQEGILRLAHVVEPEGSNPDSGHGTVYSIVECNQEMFVIGSPLFIRATPDVLKRRSSWRLDECATWDERAREHAERIAQNAAIDAENA